MKIIHVIKVGGNVLDNEVVLNKFLKDFVSIEGPKVLVHGGGKLANEISSQLDIPVKMIEGRRVTDAASLKVVTQVYAGLINKTLVAKLQAAGCNALGLSGADLNSIPASKRQHPSIDFGFVGDFEVKDINTSMLDVLLDNNITPVFCAITHDQKGQLLNTNADTIAAGLATAFSAQYQTHLTFCFEKKGVLSDPKNDESVIKNLDSATFSSLRDTGAIHSGMIPKLDNAFMALKSGVTQLRITHADLLSTQQGTILSL